MVKSTVATAVKTAEELKNEFMQFVKAIVDDDDDKAEAFKGASRALFSLRDLKMNGNGSNGSRMKNAGMQGSVPILAHGLCSISTEIMKDPVVLPSGQTHDQLFIQEGLNSGNRTCPQTQQVLTNPTLTPEHIVRSMISKWCTKDGIALHVPNNYNPDEPPIPAAERSLVRSIMTNLSSSSITVKKQAVKDIRLLTKQKTTVRAYIGQNPDAILKLLAVLSVPGLDGDGEVQEDAVTTMLNLAIFDSNKKILGDDPQNILFLIEALKTGTMQTRGNAAAALCRLSALDSNNIKIGELGAMRPLIELLEHGTLEAKEEAANAIFDLCTNYDNGARAVRDGVARVLLMMIMDKLLVVLLLDILAMVSGHKKVAEEVVEMEGVSCLFQIIKESSCALNRENAAVVLHSICVDHGMKLREIGEEEAMHGTISDLVNTGTPIAHGKASGILDRLRKTMRNTHYSC